MRGGGGKRNTGQRVGAIDRSVFERGNLRSGYERRRSLTWSFFWRWSTIPPRLRPLSLIRTSQLSVQLTVRDLLGNQGIANVRFVVGNTRPVSPFAPPNGAIFDWGKGLAYQVSAFDAEDGSTTMDHRLLESGHSAVASATTITRTAREFIMPARARLSPRSILIRTRTTSFLLSMPVIPTRAPRVSSLIGTASFTFPPRHKQAEFCTTNTA